MFGAHVPLQWGLVRFSRKLSIWVLAAFPIHSDSASTQGLSSER